MLIWRFRFSVLFGLILFLSGCASVNYDEQADTQLTNITQEVNQQFTTWEDQAQTKSVPYDAKFYDKLEADLKSLEIRMEASQDPATQHLVGAFDNLNQDVEKLRRFHMHHGSLPPEFFHAQREIIDQPLAALITFELSLKPSGIGGSQSAKTESTAVAATESKAPAAKATVSKIVGQ